MNSTLPTYPLRYLRRPPVSYVLRGATVLSGGTNYYVGDVGIEDLNVLGTADFSVSPPLPLSQNYNVGFGSLLVLRDNTVVHGEVRVSSGGVLRVLSN